MGQVVSWFGLTWAWMCLGLAWPGAVVVVPGAYLVGSPLSRISWPLGPFNWVGWPQLGSSGLTNASLTLACNLLGLARPYVTLLV